MLTGYSSTVDSMRSMIDELIMGTVTTFAFLVFFFVLFYGWYRVYRRLSFDAFDKVPFENKNKKRIYLDDNHSLSFSLEDAFGEFEYDTEYL